MCHSRRISEKLTRRMLAITVVIQVDSVMYPYCTGLTHLRQVICVSLLWLIDGTTSGSQSTGFRVGVRHFVCK